MPYKRDEWVWYTDEHEGFIEAKVIDPNAGKTLLGKEQLIVDITGGEQGKKSGQRPDLLLY